MRLAHLARFAPVARQAFSKSASSIQHGGRRLQRIVAQAASAELTVVVEQLSPTVRKMQVTVPGPLVQESFQSTVENLRKITGNLPGFRTDKIPLSMLITQCGGQAKFKQACIEEVLLTAMPLAMEQVKEAVIPESERISSNVRQLQETFDPAKPMTFEIEFETAAPLVWKRSYRDVEVTIRDTGNFETDVAAAEALLRTYRKEKGQQRVVHGRGIEMGDVCIGDLEVRLLTGMGGRQVVGKPLPGLGRTRAFLDTEVDPLGIAKGMVGMKQGEERKVRFTFPEDYGVSLWQGLEAEASVKVHEIFSWVLPEVDDEFVKANFPRFSSAEEMKKALVATTAMERVKDLDNQLEEAVMQGVLSCIEPGEVSERLVMEMGMQQYRAVLLDMASKRIADQAQIEALSTEAMVDEYITKRRRELEDLVRFNQAVDEIFDGEKLTLEEKDVEEEVGVRRKQYEGQKLDFDEGMLREQVRETFKHVKVVEWLKDNLKRNVVPWQPAAAGAQ